MRLKTYIVQNVSEALPMIKRDLGADALILNTKKVKTGGFIGFFQKERLEVTAAVEAQPKKKKAASKAPEEAAAVQKASLPVPPASIAAPEDSNTHLTGD